MNMWKADGYIPYLGHLTGRFMREIVKEIGECEPKGMVCARGVQIHVKTGDQPITAYERNE